MNRSLKIILLVISISYLALEVFLLAFKGNEKDGFVQNFARIITEPVHRSLNKATLSIENFVDHYVFLVNTSKTNQRLLKEIEVLHSKLTDLKEIEAENVRLRTLLEVPSKNQIDVLGAERVSIGISPYQRIIRISIGLQQNLNVGEAVLTNRGIVGQVYKVYSESSDVLLLVDKIHAIDVINQRTRQRALLRGDTLKSLKFEFLPLGSDIREGDELVSSGLDGVFPKGIPVGFVSNIKGEQQQLFVDAQVKPYVDFRNLEEVLVARKALTDN